VDKLPRAHPWQLLLAGIASLASIAVSGAGLEYASRGNRFEGTRELKIASAPPLELLSFVRESSELRSDSAGLITLQFYLPAAASVEIRAGELVSDRYYEMRPAQTQWSSGWNTFEPWPTAEVLAPLGVRISNLGVVATLADTQRARELVAVLPTPAARGALGGSYAFTFRTRNDLRKADWVLRADSADAALRRGSLQATAGGAPATIVFNMGSLADGYYRLYIDCRYEGQPGGPEFDFRFYHRATR
jgi:hypothetical protein